MNNFKLDTRPWYIGHIIALVGVAFIGGHYLQDWICANSGFCIERFQPTSTMIIANLIYYSILAYLFDTGFHSITGLD
jgi:membrane protein YqaA with SNARE-associated domain